MTFETRGLSFGYAKDRTIFENIGFSVGKGEIFCILGPNGTGKTSLLRCRSGISMPLTGSVTIDGKDLHSLSRAEVAKRLGFMPQLHSSIFPYTALEVAVMGRSPHLGIAASPSERDYDLAWKNLELLGISSLAEKPYTRISGGEQQMVLLSMLLTQQPDIMLLDEPTSHLDFGNQVRLLELLRRFSKKGFSVVFTTHFPSHAFQLSCTVALMNKGTFESVGPAETQLTEENLRRIYGVDLCVEYVSKANSRTCVPIIKNDDGRGVGAR